MFIEADKQALQIILINCDITELKEIRRDLNGMIDYKSQQNLRTFKIGDKIEWDSKKKSIMRGVITKINTKTVYANTDKGPWRIAVSLIRKATETVVV
jgi:hypothetical protein